MNLPAVPIECRNLSCEESSASRGVVRCWVDIMTEKDAPNTPIWNILPRPSEKFQIRIVVWSVLDMPLMDFEGMSDLFVICKFEDQKK